jgi:hypothetical protein
MRKKKNKTEVELPLFIQKSLENFKERLRGLSNYLQKKTDIYPAGKKKFFLILFCFVVACECSILIFTSVRNNGRFYYTVSPIKFIPIIKQPTNYPRLSDKELKQIQDFNIYLDTLSKKDRDSLFNIRPHLSDSIEIIKAIYRKQLKK